MAATGSCDDRCTTGKEGSCQCSCGGANHGTAKKVYETIKDGGNATVKGGGLDLFLEQNESGQIQVTNQVGTKVQTYRSESEFCKDLGKLIRAGRVEINATDAYNRRQVHLTADPERSNKVPKLTDKEALKQIRATGATVKKVDGEYIVNVPGGTEGTAYYTDDRADAVGTAKVMMERHSFLTEDGYVLKGDKGFVKTNPYGSISYSKSKEDATFFYTKEQAEKADFGNNFQKVEYHKPIQQFDSSTGKYEKVRKGD